LAHFGKNLVIVGALLAAGFLIAWLRFRPFLGSEGAYSDGVKTYDVASAGEVRYAVWDLPQPFAGDVNTGEDERRPTLSPDGRHLVFAAGERGLGADLYIADMVEGRAVDVRPLAVLNTGADEWAPCFGGGALYFASDRRGTSGGLDLWRAPYDRGTFGPAERLNGGVNSSADDTDPAPIPGSEAIVFASNRRHERRDDFELYLARPDRTPEAGPKSGASAGAEQAEARGGNGADDSSGAWRVEPIVELNTPFDERDPALTADGKTMFFASDRDGTLGGFDLYRTVFGAGRWLAPEPLHGVNSTLSERGPSPSPDGFQLAFHVEGPGGADLYSARSIELFRTPGRPVGWRELLVIGLLLAVALLATLAKYWEQLEVVYKCFLVSVVVHLLLMWWMRDVYPEGGEYELQGESNRIRIRLLDSGRGPQAQNTEHGGRLEVARAPSAAEAGPEKAATEVPDATADPAQAPSVQVARAEAAEVSAPSRASEQLARAELELRPADVALREAAEAFQRMAGTAPALALDAGAAARYEARTVADPGRSESIEPRIAATSPSSTAVPRAAGEAALPAAPSSAQVELAPAAHGGTSAVAVAEPRESVTRMRGAAPELALEAGFTSAPVPRGETILERATARAADVLEGRVATADDAAPLAVKNRAARDEGFDPLAGRALPEVERQVAPRALGAELERPRETFERMAGRTAVAAELFVTMPVERARPAPDRSAELEQRALQHRETAGDALVLTPRRFERLERTTNEAEPFAAAPQRFALADVRPLTRALPAIELEDTEERTEPRIGDSTQAAESERIARWDAGLARDLSDSLLALPAPDRSREPSRATEPGRWQREAPAPEPEPTFRPLVAKGTARPELDDIPVSQQRWEHTPYRSRTGTQKLRAIEEHGGSQETERAVASGLAYLARKQARQGYWGSPEDAHEKYGHVSVGKTGLAMLAFMGAGHTQRSGTEYSRVVTKAIDFLLAVQDEASGHFGYTSAYSHGIATYSLAECFALTGDERLRRPLERAVQQILRHQKHGSDPRFHGGWSYYYPDDRTYDRWARVSVTAWQVMALESARLGGLSVPDEVFKDARTFLTKAWDHEREAFRYNHDPNWLGSYYPILPGSTPAALFALSLLGEDIGQRRWGKARTFVLEKAPRRYRFTTSEDFVYKAQANLYFMYYGTLAMFRVEGDDWATWNEAMKKMLLPAQDEDGSWKPISVYNEFTGDDDRDRSYTTAMCVLSLEVYYRYFTPLLKVD